MVMGEVKMRAMLLPPPNYWATKEELLGLIVASGGTLIDGDGYYDGARFQIHKDHMNIAVWGMPYTARFPMEYPRELLNKDGLISFVQGVKHQIKECSSQGRDPCSED